VKILEKIGVSHSLASYLTTSSSQVVLKLLLTKLGVNASLVVGILIFL
jgi:hypothetical protein